MSRLEETESVINCTDWCNGWEGEARSMHHIARTLAAERDELQRRLDALLAMLEASADNECYCDDDDCYPIEVCERHTLYRRARAIAEGRTE